MKPQIKDCDHSAFVEADWKDKPTLWSELALQHGRAYCSCCGNGIEYSKDNGGIKCPYGKPGDILWVRETSAITYSTAPKMKRTVWYKADNPVILERVSFKWKPSIHMPKGSARIWLQVADIRVERLQDISEEDARAEGVEKLGDFVFPYKHYAGENSSCIDAKTSFRTLWQEINGDESWAANPWVWVISFKVLSTTGKPAIWPPKS